MPRPRRAHVALTLTTALGVAGLTACSGGEADAFCDDFTGAGGDLVTMSNFQVGMPREDTIVLLTDRLDVLDAVTPPEEIASEWDEFHAFYTEVLAVAEQTPAGQPVVDEVVFGFEERLGEQDDVVMAYLDEHCF